MPILKRECLEDGFAQINNTLLQRGDMSYGAKGLLCELLSRPEDWVVYKKQLYRDSCGERKLGGYFKELQTLGYLRIDNVRDESDSKITDRVWVVSSQPALKTQTNESPYSDNALQNVNPTKRRFDKTSSQQKDVLQIKTNTNKDKITNKEKSSFGKTGNSSTRNIIPPASAQVKEYADSIDYALDADNFCDFYASKGWLVGKAKMKDWQAAVRQWQRRDTPEEDDWFSQIDNDQVDQNVHAALVSAGRGVPPLEVWRKAPPS